MNSIKNRILSKFLTKKCNSFDEKSSKSNKFESMLFQKHEIVKMIFRTHWKPINILSLFRWGEFYTNWVRNEQYKFENQLTLWEWVHFFEIFGRKWHFGEVKNVFYYSIITHHLSATWCLIIGILQRVSSRRIRSMSLWSDVQCNNTIIYDCADINNF